MRILVLALVLFASGCITIRFVPEHGNTVARSKSECFDYWTGKGVNPAWGPLGCIPRLPWK